MLARNMGKWDRLLRAIGGLALVTIGMLQLGGAEAGLRTAVVVLGAASLLTAASGFCLLYRLLGISMQHSAEPALDRLPDI